MTDRGGTAPEAYETAGAGGSLGEVTLLRSQVAALEQLLDVHEHTSLEQATRLEQTLREREELLARERAARDALVASEQRLRLALEAGRMGTWEWDIIGARIIWSPEEELLYGLPPGAFSGSIDEYRERIHPDDREQALTAVMEALQRKAPTHHILHRIVKPDGEVRWLDSHARFLSDDAGQPVRLVGVSTDVTERLEIQAARDRALAAAKAERQRLYEVFMQAPAAIAVLEGPEHVFTVANPLYLELVGRAPGAGKTVQRRSRSSRARGSSSCSTRCTSRASRSSATRCSFGSTATGTASLEDVYFNFVYQPLQTADGRVVRHHGPRGGRHRRRCIARQEVGAEGGGAGAPDARAGADRTGSSTSSRTSPRTT